MDAVKTIKGYELHERVGSGGFGVVHRATQTTIGREVAIKIIAPHFANQPDFIRRFETEAQLIARLEHPHIVPLYDYWRDLGGAYLVMRWLRGGSLRDALSNEPFGLEAAALFLDQIAAALTVAHRNGVVHRDLKPANILLDEDGNVYLSDFGIAKDTANAASTDTEPGVVLGSPAYLAPEQARCESVTPQTDIYSLGVMLYEVLTGHHPFPNVSTVELMYKHLNQPLPPIDTLPAEVADGVNAVIQKATAKNPAQRYPDALALAAAFRSETALDRRGGDSIVEQLTFREQEILQMIVEGCSNKEIAQRLFVTVATVKWHIHGVYQKLRVRSRVQAVVKARELNLIISDTGAESTVVEPALVALAEPENPYKGLRAFQLADARDFFGRERLIQRLIKRLGEPDRLARFLAIIGPSGSGKSSVVRAGLMPALWRGDLPGSDRWFVVEMMPGTHPFDELEIALTRVAANQSGSLREQLDRDARGLLRVASLILPDDESELVVIVDQFEEIFTLVDDEARRRQFINLLQEAIVEPRSRVRVIITLRADFYDRPLQYAEFGELVRSRMETVMPLSADELEEAIVRPAERVGVSYEPGLVAAIIGDVHYQPGALPLLQYALTELFEQHTDRMLTHEAYQALGGAAGALAKRAEALYHEQADAGQETIRQMFLRLVSLGEGSEDTRRRVPRAELLAIASSEELMDDILDTYAAYRLLTMDHDPATRRPTVEIAHEAILREWERLRSWLNESRHDIRQQRLLAAAAAEWVHAERDPSYLLRGARLDQMSSWAAETRLALTRSEREFLETSVSEHQRQENAEQERQRRELATQRQLAEQQRRAANRLRYLVAALAVFLVGAIVFAGFALEQEQKAQEARIVAQQERDKSEREANVNHSLVLANSALQSYDNGDTVLAASLALEAAGIADPPAEAGIALREIAQGAGIRTVLLGHVGLVNASALSPDGRYALSGGCSVVDAQENCTEGELILWDVQAESPIGHLDGHSGRVNSVAFAPDGQTALSASSDGSAVLWSVPDGELIRRFEGHTGGINSVAFSPDGRTFVSASDDTTLIQWDVETGAVLQRFEGHTDAVDCVVFSPDGQSILSGSADMTAIQWSVAAGTPMMSFEGHGSPVTGVALTLDGRMVSVTRNSLLYLWDAKSGAMLRQQNFSGNPSDLKLAPGGRVVLFPELGHLRAWDIDQWQLSYGLSYYETGKHRIASIGVSADGRTGIYGTEEGELVLWALPATGEIRRFGDQDTRLTYVAVSPDGRYLLGGTSSGEGVLLDRESGEEIRRLRGMIGYVYRITFSADGRLALFASVDWFGNSGKGSFALWDVETGEQLQLFSGYQYLPNSVDLSSDGRFALGSTTQWGSAWDKSGAGETIVWNTATGEEVVRIDSDKWINESVFTADGRSIITGSGTADATGLAVWDAETGQQISRYLSDLPVIDIRLVPGSTLVLVGAGSGEILLLDYETGEVVRRFCCHSNWVRTMDLSSNQRYLVSGDNAGVLILWDFAAGQEVRRFYGHSSILWAAAFSPDGQELYSAGFDGHIIEWQIADQPLDELIAWVRANRYIRDFTCAERVQYRIEPLCST